MKEFRAHIGALVLVTAVSCLLAACGGVASMSKDEDSPGYAPSVIFAWIEKDSATPNLHVRFNEDVAVEDSSGWSFYSQNGNIGASALSFASGAVQGGTTSELTFPLKGSFATTDTFEISYKRSFGNVKSVKTGVALEDVTAITPANSYIPEGSDYVLLVLDSNGGSPEQKGNPIKVALNTKVSLPTNESGITRDNFVLAGWAATQNGTDPVANPYTPTQKEGKTDTVYAMWKAGKLPDPPAGDVIHYEISANGETNIATTTSLHLLFEKGVALVPGNITITQGTATLNIANLTGSGRVWELGVNSVSKEGYVNFKITANGIENSAKQVPVHKYDSTKEGGGTGTGTGTGGGNTSGTPYQYIVATDGDSANKTTTMVFSFESPILLRASEIQIKDESVVTKGVLYDAGTAKRLWILKVNALKTAKVDVQIVNNASVAAGWNSVNVYMGDGTSIKDDGDTGGGNGGGGGGNGNGNGNGGGGNGDGTNGQGANYSIFADGANGVQTTTKLYLVFEKTVTLTAGNITIANDSGQASASGFVAAGDVYEIPVTTAKAGVIHVSIPSVSGVFSGVKSVTVHKSGTVYPPNSPAAPNWPPSQAIDYTVAVNNPTTHLIFGFDSPIRGSGLTQANVTITDDTGKALKTSTFRGATSTYILDVTGVVTGWVNVSITNYSGYIVSTPKKVYVYAGAAALANYMVNNPIGSPDPTVYLEIAFYEGDGSGLELSHIIFDNSTATKGSSLTGGPVNFILSVTANSAGTLNLHINKAGISSEGKTVWINKTVVTPPPIPPTPPTPPGGGNGGSAVTTFSTTVVQPQGVATDASGNVYVVSAGSSPAVYKINAAGNSKTTVSNSSNFGINISGIAIYNSDVYVADMTHDVIWKLANGTTGSNITPTVAAGSKDNHGYANATGTNAKFQGVSGLAVYGSDLYIADAYNHAIRKMVISSGAVTTFAGAAPVASSTGNGSYLGVAGDEDGTGAGAKFSMPQDVAVTSGGVFYVADSGNRKIRKITSNGTVTTVNPITSTGAAGFIGIPTGVTLDSSGNVYFVDSALNTYAVINKIVPSDSNRLYNLAGSGTPGDNDGTPGYNAKFRNPAFIAIDSNNNLFVSDNTTAAAGRVRKIAP